MTYCLLRILLSSFNLFLNFPPNFLLTLIKQKQSRLLDGRRSWQGLWIELPKFCFSLCSQKQAVALLSDWLMGGRDQCSLWWLIFQTSILESALRVEASAFNPLPIQLISCISRPLGKDTRNYSLQLILVASAKAARVYGQRDKKTPTVWKWGQFTKVSNQINNKE